MCIISHYSNHITIHSVFQLIIVETIRLLSGIISVEKKDFLRFIRSYILSLSGWLAHSSVNLTIHLFTSFIMFGLSFIGYQTRVSEGLEKGGGYQGRVIKEEGMRGGKGSDRRGVSGARGLNGSAIQLTSSHYSPLRSSEVCETCWRECKESSELCVCVWGGVSDRQKAGQ